MPRKQPKHDSFFSGSLELIPIALAFFKQHIPGHLQQIVESQTITRIDRKNTDAKLKQRLRDIIYQTSLYPNGTCYCTVEHQSQPKFDMPLRLLQYQLDTIRIHRQAGNKSWPMVVSLLFYHGKTTPYPYPCRSTDYYEYPHWSDQQLYFQFHLIDITQISDKEILAHGICAPMELLLKHSRDGSFELPIEVYRPIFQECIRRVGDEYVTTMLV